MDKLTFKEAVQTIVNAIKQLVRPFLAVTLITVTSKLFLADKIKPEMILGLLGAVIGFYFAERALKKAAEKVADKTVEEPNGEAGE